jgi:hypothetical protein
MSSLVIKSSDIKDVIDKSIDILKNSLKTVSDNDGNIGGWHQFIHSEKIGAVATSQAVSCFAYFNKEFTKLQLAINFLESNQLEDGGFALSTMGEKSPMVESTSWSILGIRNKKDTISKEISTNGAEWLKNNKNDDNGWGPIKSMDSRVYASALALWALSTIDDDNYQTIINNGIDWIKKARNTDNCWGELPNDDKSTPFHTAFIIFVLMRCGFSADSDIISKATNWLNDQWNTEDMWESYSEATNLVEYYDMQIMSSRARITWNHFATPWVIIALLSCGIINKKVFRGVEWLINFQTNEGCWKHPNTNDLTLWSIHDVLFCIKSFLDHVFSIENYDSLELHDDVLILKGEFTIGKKVKSWINVAIAFTKEHWSWIIICLILLMGGICFSKNIISSESYVIGLIFPILLLIMSWMYGKLYK